MANLKASIKDIRKTKRRTTLNRRLRNRVKAAIKGFSDNAAKGDSAKAKKAYVQATKILDKASAKGVLKKNAASRKKSRLALQLNKMTKAKA